MFDGYARLSSLFSTRWCLRHTRSAAPPLHPPRRQDKKKDDAAAAEIEEKRGHYERKIERALKKGDKEKAAEYTKKLSKLPPRPAGAAAPAPKPKTEKPMKAESE